MKKSNLMYYAAVAFSMAAIAAVIVFKFIIPGDNPNQFRIENTTEIVLTDLIRGWSGKQEFSPFFMIKKVDFYRYIHSPVLPVLVHLAGHTVKNYRYILP